MSETKGERIHREEFLELLAEYQTKFPRARRFCLKKKASVLLAKLDKLQCWDCHYFIGNPDLTAHASCDPL